jgi:hypothetical protein
MSVTSFDLAGRLAACGTKRSGVWRGLAQSLAQGVDALVAHVATHAVSEQALRRADADMRRWQELMARRGPTRNVDLARLRSKVCP